VTVTVGLAVAEVRDLDAPGELFRVCEGWGRRWVRREWAGGEAWGRLDPGKTGVQRGSAAQHCQPSIQVPPGTER
jgi:hypothetical protein